MDRQKQFYFHNLSKYRNVLMGMQVLLIILFHFTEDCKVYDAYYSGLIYWFYNYIGSSGVDMFLLLAGMGVYFSWKKHPDYREFYKKRFMRILIPYGVVAGLAWLWRDVFFEGAGFGEYIKDLTFFSFFSEGKKWFWYIFMILVCYLIFPFLFRVVEYSKNRFAEKFRILVLCLMTTLIVIVLKQCNPELYSNIDIAILRFPAFFAGCLMGKAAYEKRNVPIWKIGAWFAAALIMAVPLQMVYIEIIGVYVRAIFNIAICFIIVIGLERISGNYNPKVLGFYEKIKQLLEWFGKYSLELYLVHVAVRRGMNLVGVHTYRIGYEIVMITISIVLSILLKYVTNVFTIKIEKKEEQKWQII